MKPCPHCGRECPASSTRCTHCQLPFGVGDKLPVTDKTLLGIVDPRPLKSAKRGLAASGGSTILGVAPKASIQPPSPARARVDAPPEQPAAPAPGPAAQASGEHSQGNSEAPAPQNTYRGVGQGAESLPLPPVDRQASKPPSVPSPPTEIRPMVPSPQPTERTERTPSSSRGRRFFLFLSMALLLGLAVEGALHFVNKEPILSATVLADDTGSERLEVRCPSCPDGTIVDWQGVREPFAQARATLTATSPVPLGTETLSVGLQRPGELRGVEAMQLAPHLYRIQAPQGEESGASGQVLFRVEAVAGTTISAPTGPVELNAVGVADYRLDLKPETTGESSSNADLEKTVRFTVHSPQLGDFPVTRSFHFKVAPLVLHAPGSLAITEGDRFLLAGKATPGAEVQVAGNQLAVDSEGSFRQLMSIDSIGETRVKVTSELKGSLRRTASFRVRRVKSLRDELSRLAEEEGPIDIVSPQTVPEQGAFHLTGRVVRVDTEGARRWLTIEPGTKCSTPPCSVRALYSGLTGVQAGDRVTTHGRVRRPVDAEPESTGYLELSLLLAQ